MDGRQQLLLVMRHGLRRDEVDETWLATASRHWDPPLAREGLAKVEAAAAELRAHGIRKVVASPFLRCLQTAAIVCKVLGLASVEVDYSLCEVLGPTYLRDGSGPQAGQSVEQWMWGGSDPAAELQRGLGSVGIAAISAGTPFPEVPETLAAAHRRYTFAIEAAADRAGGQNVLLITHGEAVGRAVSRLLPWAAVYAVDHCGYATAWRAIDSEGEPGLWEAIEGAEGQAHGVRWRSRQ